ncbi:hypothetical protein QJS66_13205 [Kocuria rhizophila]|nr:hypothetical protein QJS66_13205 [Kocuria rhizophila]
MREAYVHGHPRGRPSSAGFHAGAPVVTAAAMIMISVFRGLGLSRSCP